MSRPFSRPVSLGDERGRPLTRRVRFVPDAVTRTWVGDQLGAARRGAGGRWFARPLVLETPDAGELPLATRVMGGPGRIERWWDTVPERERARIDNRELPAPARTGIFVETPPALAGCPRAAAFAAYAGWIDAAPRARELLGLPRREVVVRLVAASLVRPGAVGRFVVRRGARYPGDLLVEAAVGPDPGEDDAEWTSRLTTLPHELAHVGQWVRRFGERSPAEVARADWQAHPGYLPSIAAWFGFDAEAGGSESPEALGQVVSAVFLREQPRHRLRPACPPGCACAS